MKLWWKTTICAAFAAAGCTTDAPLEVGRDLLPDDAIQSWEVILPADRFIKGDTAFGLFGRPSDADYVLLADEADGALTSRVLVRYELPRTILVRGAGESLRVDSFPRFVSGTITLLPDSNVALAAGAVELRRTTQSWDRATATWTNRVDSAGTVVPWAQPGGSPGALISTTSFAAGPDTVSLPVDSATLAEWADTTNSTRGGIILLESTGSRLRSPIPVLRVNARSTLADTVVTITLAPGRTFIYTPEQPDVSSMIRVGGVQQWRTLLALRAGLDTVTVPCPPPASCRVPLRDVTISFAALQLQPVPAPAGFAPERAFGLSANGVLPSVGLPLQRSPITEPFGRLGSPIPTSSFTTAGAPIAEVPITNFARVLFGEPTAAERPTYFALLPFGPVRTFGFGTFQSMPSMRLILSTARELQLP